MDQINQILRGREFIGDKFNQLERKFTSSSYTIQVLKNTDILNGHEECVNTIAFDSTGKYVVSGSDDETIKIWDFGKRQCIDTLYGHSTNVFTADFLSNKDVVSGGNDSDVRHFELIGRTCTVYPHHTKKVLKLSVNPRQPQTFLTCSADGTVRMFDIRCKYQDSFSHSIPTTHTSSNEVEVLPQMFGGGRTSDRVVLQQQQNNNNNNNHNHSGYHLHTSTLVVNFDSIPLRRSLRSSFKKQSTTIFTVEFHPNDGHSFITSASDGSVRLFDLRSIQDYSSGSYVNIYRNLHKPWPTVNECTGCVFSKDGTEILATYLSDDIYLYDVQRNVCRELNLDYFKDHSVKKRRLTNNNVNNAQRKKKFLFDFLNRFEEDIHNNNLILQQQQSRNNRDDEEMTDDDEEEEEEEEEEEQEEEVEEEEEEEEKDKKIDSSNGSTQSSFSNLSDASHHSSSSTTTTSRSSNNTGESRLSIEALEYCEDVLDQYYNDLIVEEEDKEKLIQEQNKDLRADTSSQVDSDFFEDEYEGYYDGQVESTAISKQDNEKKIKKKKEEEEEEEEENGSDDQDGNDADDDEEFMYQDSDNSSSYFQDDDDNDEEDEDEDDDFFDEEEEEEEEIEEDLDKTSIPKSYKHRYNGHISNMTIKSCSFYGSNSEYVMTGSDDHHIFIWEKKSGQLVRILEGHNDVVNCTIPHPNLPQIISCGLDNDIFIWEPEDDYPNQKELAKREKQISQFIDIDHKKRRIRSLDDATYSFSTSCAQQ